MRAAIMQIENKNSTNDCDLPSDGEDVIGN